MTNKHRTREFLHWLNDYVAYRLSDEDINLISNTWARRCAQRDKDAGVQPEVLR